MSSCLRRKTGEYSARAPSLIHMKLTSLASTVLLLFGLAGLGLAAPLPLKAGKVIEGTFTLKDGKIIEGKVVREQGDAYVIEYQVNKDKKGITDIKIVPKKDVLKITTVKPDEQAFEVLAKLLPTPDLLTAEDYKQRSLAVQAFITKFPQSAKLKDAQAILKTLAEESAAVAAGGRKLQGLMILAADYRANAFDLDARVLEAKIRDAAAKSQGLALLRTFVDFDKDYQSAACYREVLPLVIKSLQAFRTQVAADLTSFDARMEKQAAEIEKMPPRDAENSKRELAARALALEAHYAKEKAAGQVWVTHDPTHKQSLEDNSTLAESELQRLSGTLRQPAPTPDGGKVFRNTWKTIHSDADAEAVEKALAEAETASLPERYLKRLQAEAKAAGAKPADK
jgi:hypothetical protein